MGKRESKKIRMGKIALNWGVCILGKKEGRVMCKHDLMQFASVLTVVNNDCPSLHGLEEFNDDKCFYKENCLECWIAAIGGVLEADTNV